MVVEDWIQTEVRQREEKRRPERSLEGQRISQM